MSNIEVLLVKPVKNLGNEGEAVRVKAGYARNFLFPFAMAVPVNRSTKRQLEVLATRRASRLAQELEAAHALQAKMKAMTLTVKVKTGDDGKPHGAITNMDLHKALSAEGITVERHQIKIGEALKTLGEHTVQVKIHSEVTVELKINVQSENPVAEAKKATAHNETSKDGSADTHKKARKVKSEKTAPAAE